MPQRTELDLSIDLEVTLPVIEAGVNGKKVA